MSRVRAFRGLLGAPKPPLFTRKGLMVYLDATQAATLTLTGARVNKINDLSGLGNHFGTSFAGTTYDGLYDGTLFGGQGGIVLSGPYQRMLMNQAPLVNAPTHNNYTVVMIGYRSRDTVHFYPVWDRSNASYIVPGTYCGRLGHQNSFNTYDNFPLDTPECLAFKNDGTNRPYYWNGLKQAYFYDDGVTMKGDSTTFGNQVLIGSNPNNTTWTMGVFLMYNRVLSDAEIRNLAIYFQGKFGYSLSKGTANYNIWYDGDSIMKGVGSLYYPTDMVVADSLTLSEWDYHNIGIGGAILQNSLASTLIDPNFNSKIVAKRNVAVLSFLANTVGSDTDGNVETLVQNWCLARRAAGYKVVVCTCLPRGDKTAGWETSRLAINSWIRANYGSFADGLADYGADPNMGQTGQYSTAYYSADHVHPSDTGHQVLGGILAPVISAVMA